ncbi:hypothetical protein A3D00_00060 [Candidatus Woesebacteria bacterium RIFCSPHIGHO2_02_FULL_38_9]|nr:MAG: hypothetical protein A3D00_00060 [Candidatus Woesebacteria bacterium RIFCSPHIGHO2_02_FULL_38_9]OGM57835.1 MAG: hypothetical protein A3A50_02370 [Candidatus Woesebacteria bacterium RIFCSPLOWO2_01_FULL_38_20]
MKKFPLVSIIVPAYNEEKVIEKILISIKKQSYKKIEVLVLDDASEDNTYNIAKKYTKKVFRKLHSERSATRNYGAKLSKGKYLMFLDADMRLTRNVVKKCVESIEKYSSMAGIIIPEKSIAKTFWEKIRAFERSFYNFEGDEVTDAARFFKREVFEKFGGYDETITGPEDWDLPEMMKENGYSFGRINSFIFHYERVPNPFYQAKKKFNYALKSHRYLSKHKISPISSKTIYFLRPVFYEKGNWKRLLLNPRLSLGMFVMFTLETIAGGFGYLLGRILRA